MYPLIECFAVLPSYSVEPLSGGEGIRGGGRHREREVARHPRRVRGPVAHVLRDARAAGEAGQPRACNTKGYSSIYLAMGFANVRAGTWNPPEH